MFTHYPSLFYTHTIYYTILEHTDYNQLISRTTTAELLSYAAHKMPREHSRSPDRRRSLFLVTEKLSKSQKLTKNVNH